MTRQKLIFVLLICLSTLIAASASALTMSGQVTYCRSAEGIPEISVYINYYFIDADGNHLPGDQVTVWTDEDGQWSHSTDTPFGARICKAQFSFRGADLINREFSSGQPYDFGPYCIHRPCPKCPDFEDVGHGQDKDLNGKTIIRFGSIKAQYR